MSQTLHNTFAEIWPRPENDRAPFPANFLTVQYRPYPNDTPLALADKIDPDTARHAIASVMALFGAHRELIAEPMRGALLTVLEPLVPEGAESLTFDDDEANEWWTDLLDRVTDPLHHTT